MATNDGQRWGAFKAVAEAQGLSNYDLLAWISVDTENPSQIIIYDLRPGQIVIEQVEEIIQDKPPVQH